MTLESFFKQNRAVALGFSGGVDSSFLLYSGIKNGALMKAIFVKTEFQPEFELRDAYRISEQIGAEMTVLEKSIFDVDNVVSNPDNRCYHCKRTIFEALCQQALADGFTVVADGTNASDDASGRPGMRALSELSVRSPLRECGITKSEVRRLSKDAGLFTWDKPAYACLATRIPTGRAITKKLLQSVEAAEGALFTLGFTDFRVRVREDAACLQFSREQMDEAFNKRKDILSAVRPYFDTVLLDPEGR